ncbi:MAG: DUF2125 domain-containing protein [Pseudomonadota bacterium]
MTFRALLLVTLLLAGGWSAYWWVGANRKEAEITGWFEDRRAEGWVAEVDTLSVSGYPNRFDTVFRGIDLADPVAGWSWQAARFNILSLSYQPNHLILTFPGVQTVETPEGGVTLEGGVLRASVEATLQGVITQLIAEGSALAVNSDIGGASVERVSLAARDEDGGAQRFGLNLVNARLDAGARMMLDPADLFPETVERVLFDATVRFDEPLVLPLVTDIPAVNEIMLTSANMVWGEAEFRAQGAVTRGADDRADGEIEIRLRDWRRMLRALKASGRFSGEVVAGLELGLGFLAQLSGGDSGLEVTLVFEDGVTRIGPFELGPAPVMALPG